MPLKTAKFSRQFDKYEDVFVIDVVLYLIMSCIFDNVFIFDVVFIFEAVFIIEVFFINEVIFIFESSKSKYSKKNV